jgi:hypothetical protein
MHLKKADNIFLCIDLGFTIFIWQGRGKVADLDLHKSALLDPDPVVKIGLKCSRFFCKNCLFDIFLK